jgi:hypothetical protein
MKRKKFTKSAATSVTGNIVETWLALNASPRSIPKLNHFANRLDFALSVIFPNGTMGGSMQGTEDEIRQNAAILLLNKFLAGNRKLMAATAKTNKKQILNQINRSMLAALKVCRRQLSRKITKERIMLDELLAEDPRLPNVLPKLNTKLWELPFALQHILALKLLQISVQTKQTSKASTKVVEAILDGKMTQAQMARKLGVSRSAVSQTVQSVTKSLRKIANDIDLL